MWPRTAGHRAVGRLVIANLPDGRVIAINRDSGEIVWDKKVAVANEFGSREKFFTAPLVVEGKVIVANGAGDGATRGWLAALDVKTARAVALVCGAKPASPAARPGRTRTTLEDRRRRHLADRLLRSGHPADHLGHRNPIPQMDPEARRATTSIPTPRWRSTSIPASWSGISSTRPTTAGLRRDRRPHAL